MSSESTDETFYLVSSLENKERLMQDLKEADSGEFVEVDLSCLEKN